MQDAATDRSVAQDGLAASAWLVAIALFFVLWILVDTLIGLARGGALGADAALFTAYGLHVVASIYEGRFGRWRTLSWLVLTAAFVALMATRFHMYLPSLWSPLLAAIGRMRDALGAGAFLSSLRGPAIVAGLLLLLDVALAHGPRLAHRPWRRSVAFLLALAATDVATLAAAAKLLPQDPSQAAAMPTGNPPLYEQPFAALLLGVDWSLNVGLVVLLAVAALPMLAPWQRAWRFHAAAPTLAIWTGLCAALAAGWIALTLIGFLYLRPQAWIVAIAAYQPAFFLLASPLLGRLARRAPPPVAVFD